MYEESNLSIILRFAKIFHSSNLNSSNLYSLSIFNCFIIKGMIGALIKRVNIITQIVNTSRKSFIENP